MTVILTTFVVAMSLCMDFLTELKSQRSPSEIKATIALLFQSRLAMLAVQWWQRNQSKSVLHVQSFCFAYFMVALSLLVALPWKKIFDMQQFACKTDNLMRNVQQNGCQQLPMQRPTHLQKQYCDYSTGCGNVSNCQWQSYSGLY